MKRKSINSTAYSANRQDMFFELEDNSWWFKHRINIFKFLADIYFDVSKEVYDIGGSNGYNAKQLQDNGYNVVLIEPTPKACENATKRGVNNVLCEAFQEYEGEISQFICLDVVEHIEDDEAFIRDIASHISSGMGRGLFSVPAFKCLWSSEDDVDGHFRRYSLKEFRKLIEKNGFTVKYINYCYAFLFLPIFLRRHCLEKIPFIHRVSERTVWENDMVNQRQFINPGGVVGWVLDLCMKSELRRIVNGKRISMGSSIICVAEKSN